MTKFYNVVCFKSFVAHIYASFALSENLWKKAFKTSDISPYAFPQFSLRRQFLHFFCAQLSLKYSKVSLTVWSLGNFSCFFFFFLSSAVFFLQKSAFSKKFSGLPGIKVSNILGPDSELKQFAKDTSRQH